MSSPTPLGELTQAITQGLAQPRHAWEALFIVAALLGAGLLARLALGRLAGARRRDLAPSTLAVAPDTGVLGRLLFPLLALALLALAEAILRRAHVLGGAADARLLRLAASVIGTLAAVRALLVLLSRVLHSATLIARIQRALATLAMVGMALYATGVLGDVVAWLAATEIPLGNAAQVSLWSLLVGCSTTIVTVLAAMWLGSLIEERLAADTALEPNLRMVLGRVARALLLLVAVLLALAFSGIDLTVLSVFGGALGVGLGLGLQRIASNYVSGFLLLLDRSLRIGDVIAVDKFFGQVTQISTRYTVLRANDGTEAIIPNEMMISSPVVNSTLSDRRVVLALPLAIAPDSDLRLALDLMRNAARSQARVLAEPAPVALLKDFAGGNLSLELDFWIADPENGRQNVLSDVAIAVLDQLRAHGIELAVPRGDWQLRDRAAPVPGDHTTPTAPGAPTTG